MPDNVYSSNFLKNSSCELQNMLEWDYSQTIAKPGGNANTWFFELTSDAYMEQQVLASTIDTVPPNFRVIISYKLTQQQNPIDANIKARVVLTVEYKDDTYDIFTIPCLGNIEYLDNVKDGWLFKQQDCVIQNKDLELIKIRVETENLLGNMQVDYISLQKDTGVNSYATEVINQQLPSLIYYSNPSLINITTTEVQPVYLGITTIQNSNLSVSLVIYGVASELCTLTITMQIDSTNITFTPIKQKIQIGDFILAIPITIPQIAQGAHYIGIKFQVDFGAIIINSSMLQLTVDGRYLSGGLSPELPHAEVQLEIHYFDLNDNKILDSVLTLVDTPISRTCWEYILWKDINVNNKCSIDNITVTLL